MNVAINLKVKPNCIKSSIGQKFELPFENQVLPGFSYHNRMAGYLVTLSLAFLCLVPGITWVEQKIGIAPAQCLQVVFFLNYAARPPGSVN